MDFIVIPYNRKDEKVNINIGKLIGGLPDCLVKIDKHQLETITEPIGINVDLFDEKRIKSFEFIPNLNLSNQSLNLETVQWKDIKDNPDIEIIKITNTNFYDMQNFLNRFRNRCDSNSNKHAFNERKNTITPFTNFLIPNYFFLDMIIHSQYPELQFFDTITKNNGEDYEIKISNDMFFKNRLYLYVYQNNNIYYAERIQFKLSRENKNDIRIIAHADNHILVPEDDIIDAYCCILISLIKSIRMKHPNKSIIKFKTDIEEEYKLIFKAHLDIFKKNIKTYCSKIIEKLHNNYYATIKVNIFVL